MAISKIKEIKIREEDGSYSDPIPMGADAVNIDTANGSNLETDLANINTEFNNLGNNLSNEAAARKNADNNLQSQINSLASGSPKGIYETTAELVTANPETGVYIITENGHIYSWTQNGNEAIDLGVYQATEIENGSISCIKTESIIKNTIYSLNDRELFFDTPLTQVVKTDGTLGTYGSWYSSDYIEISDNINKIHFSSIPVYADSSTIINGISFFNSEYEYISGINKNTPNLILERITGKANYVDILSGDYTLPEGTAYIKVSHYGSSQESEVKSLNKVYELDESLLSNHIFSESESSNIRKTIAYFSYDFDTYLKQAILEDGSISTAYSAWQSTDYIEINSDIDRIIFDDVPYYWLGDVHIVPIAFYNENKEYIGYLNFNSDEYTRSKKTLDSNYYNNVSGELIISEDIKYIRVTHFALTNGALVSTNTIKYLMPGSFIAESLSSIFSDIKELQNSTYLEEWKNKSCVFLGDSITAGTGTTRTYWRYLEDLINITPHGYGVGGAQSTAITTQIDTAISELGDNIDVIFVFFGTNDFYGGIPIGEWYTETSENVVINSSTGATAARKKRQFITGSDTFKARLNTQLGYLKNKCSTKQIVIMTPIHRAYATFSDTNIQYNELYANSKDIYFEEYIDAIREAADIYSLQLIDLYRDCGLFPLDSNYSQYFRNADTDMLHPNALGHQRMAQTIMKELKIIPPVLTV